MHTRWVRIAAVWLATLIGGCKPEIQLELEAFGCFEHSDPNTTRKPSPTP